MSDENGKTQSPAPAEPAQAGGAPEKKADGAESRKQEEPAPAKPAATCASTQGQDGDVREPGFLKLLTWFLSNKRTGMVQFVKYGGVGAFCTLMNVVLTMWLSASVLMCIPPEDSHKELFFGMAIDLPHVSADFPKWVRITYFAINSTIGFLVSNIACWLLDRIFVFRPGRHKTSRELAYFVAVSGVALGVGQAVQAALMYFAEASSWTSLGANILAALSINFAARKFFVFKG